MEHDGPRWRIRISTLMLIVIIVALVFERLHREVEMRRTEAALQRMALRLRAEEEARRVQAFVGSAPAPAQQGTPNTGQETEAGAP